MQPLSRRDLTALFILIIASALIFGLPLDNLIYNAGRDYDGHVMFTQALLHGDVLLIHLVFHISTALVHMIPIFTLDMAAWIVVVLYFGLTAGVVYLWVRPLTRFWGVALGIALLLLIVTPISMFRISGRGFYFGYIGINVVHNPTMAPLKFFSLLALIFVLRASNGTLPFSRRNVLIGALLIALSMFSKPNFALVLLPALMLVLGVRVVVARNFTGFRLLVFGLIIPMIVLLIFQYVVQYYLVPNPTGSRIVFDPFTTLQYYEGSRLILGLKFLLSIAFPLAVAVFYRRAAFADLGVILGWLMLAAGAAQMYLFAESGMRRYDGNFWWSAQIALFLLFVVSVRLFIAQFKREPRAYITGAILALHVVSGSLFLLASTFAAQEIAHW